MSQKGGVGKSALARSAAVALAAKGRRVLLADFDENQATCLRWRAQRKLRKLKPKISAGAYSRFGKLSREEGRYDDIVMDSPGRLNKKCIELARVADAIFLPTSFSLDDLVPTLRVVEVLHEHFVPSDNIAVVFCRTGASRPQEAQARAILKINGLTTLNAALPQKDGYAPLFATGRTGRESPNPFLRNAALRLDEEIIAFIDRATYAHRAA